jgi:hypothetical protein
MKTVFLSCIFTFMLFATNATAQNIAWSKSSIAVLGGFNLQNLNGKDSEGESLDNSLIFGYHAGINIQVPVAPEFFFQPGLLLTQKGAKDIGNNSTFKYRLSYLELPLNFMYKALVGKGYFMLGFGPYLGYGIGGKAIYEDNTGTTKSDIKFKNVVNSGDPSDVSYFRPFDAGGNIFFGYELPEGIFMQFNAQLGMINIHPEDNRFPDDDSTVKNTGFGISLGYRF